MKATRGAAHQDWEFDGKTITVHIPMAWKRHGGRKVIPKAAMRGPRRSRGAATR